MGKISFEFALKYSVYKRSLKSVQRPHTIVIENGLAGFYTHIKCFVIVVLISIFFYPYSSIFKLGMSKGESL